jgi:hypothetical protein
VGGIVPLNLGIYLYFKTALVVYICSYDNGLDDYNLTWFGVWIGVVWVVGLGFVVGVVVGVCGVVGAVVLAFITFW